IRLIPNGCDEDIRVAPPEGNAAYDELRDFEGKVVGFVGNLEKKIDIGLISAVAERFPKTLILLIGSTHANPEVTQLRRHPNVRMPGVVPYEQMGAWLSHFDVGII